jgi:hypothetical protein
VNRERKRERERAKRKRKREKEKEREEKERQRQETEKEERERARARAAGPKKEEYHPPISTSTAGFTCTQATPMPLTTRPLRSALSPLL